MPAPLPGGDAAPARVPDLTALTLLVAVARTGSLATAARESGLSVQAAGARVRTVEQLVGAPVLERGRRGRRSSRLTARGALLVGWAGPVLAAARDLDAAVAALRPPAASGEPVVLAAAPTVAEYLLPAWLVELRDGPGGDVALLDTDDPAAAVRDGDAAVGVVESPGPLDKLHAATVASGDLVLVVPPGHAWAGTGITVAELAATPLVSRFGGAGARPALQAALHAALQTVPETDPESPPQAAPDATPQQASGAASAGGDDPGRVAAPLREVATDGAVLAAVRDGVGPAVLPRPAVATDLNAATLVEVAVAGLDARQEFRAVWQEGTSPRGTARDLLRIATGGRIR